MVCLLLCKTHSINQSTNTAIHELQPASIVFLEFFSETDLWSERLCSGWETSCLVLVFLSIGVFPDGEVLERDKPFEEAMQRGGPLYQCGESDGTVQLIRVFMVVG